jgi:uncharacterized damage-inducible protein DinB
MSISESLLPEFDHEMANTRKTLERVPEDKFDWRPHPKSTTLGYLATHLGFLPGWAVNAINLESLDLAPGGGPPPKVPAAASRQEVLDMFDKNVTEARAAIAGASDEHLLKPWSLLMGGRTIMTMPRIAVLRGMVMNHNVHHRAQLGVYLRLNDVAVPAIYGPSADEGAF